MSEAGRARMRTGYTTGACAAAAAKAATLALAGGRPVAEVEIALPVGRRASFAVHRLTREGARVTASVIKDAGDDPDVTHGAEICATVSWRADPGLLIDRGEGVGVVTKPGLGLPVGAPAINPVPRRMIAAAVAEALGEAGGPVFAGAGRGLLVVISCPDGAERAQKTLNPRLGIVGGISILGTTGLVIPYSTAAFRASVARALDVARASGCEHVVLTTGGRSETFARRLLPGLPEEAFVQMGEFLGFALQEAARRGFRRVTVCGMVGKLSKAAAGHFHLHARASEVDPEFLAAVAAACGAPAEVVAEVRGVNTARHFAEIALARGIAGVFDHLCRLAVSQAQRYLEAGAGRSGFPALPRVEFWLTDFEGNLLGSAG